MTVKKFTFILGTITIIAILIGLFIFASTKTPGDTVGEDDGFFNNLFPFGDSQTDRERFTDTQTDNPPIQRDDILNNEGFVYGQISEEPVAGAIWLREEDDSPETIRYAERATGHVYDFDMEKLNSSRITNTTVPKLYVALFTNDATALFGQYLKESSIIETFSSKIDQEGGAITETSILEQNIKDIDVSPDGNTVLYVTNNSSGSKIISTDALGSSKKEVYSSRFSEWLIDWINNNNALLYTKPSGDTEGFVYRLNANSGNVTKFMPSKKGLLVNVSPSEKSVLYSYTLANRKVGLFLQDSSSGSDIFLPIETLPEKCAWSLDEDYLYCAVPLSMSSGTYPDDWYKGSVLFSDEFWLIDTKFGEVTEIFAPNKEGYSPVDAVDIQLSKSGEFIFFKNKIDLTLWGLKVGDTDTN